MAVDLDLAILQDVQMLLQELLHIVKTMRQHILQHLGLDQQLLLQDRDLLARVLVCQVDQ
jgi:hypothetical protein